ncbi:DKNYY domain-containing protein [Chryseobacterium lactis]|uniref:DKNYY domain-containing protein n=1 Tax=Chryseobacterium lactis TaxID=1241981 RepID=UPI00162A2C32|nr:DKNYY domain-containing protein [Chryseobacterium lactis]
MKYFLLVFSFVFSVKTYAQKIDSIKDPVVNPALLVEENPKLASYVYLVNDHTIVFQKDRRTRKVIKADTKSFTFSQNSNERGMAKNKDGIFVNGNFVKTDTLGYQYLGFTNEGPFWRTQKAIYKNITELKNFKASEFTPLKDSKGTYSDKGYYRFNDQVYYHDKLTKIDPGTVVLLEWERCYDKNGIYERGEKILFEGEPLLYLSRYFLKMKNVLVSNDSYHTAIPAGDADSFVQLGEYYSKDKNNVYYKDRIFRDVDIPSFVSVFDFFAKDRNHVYHDDDLVKDADAATFEHLEGPYFKDKNHIYCNGKIMPIDIADAGKLKIWSAISFNISNPFITDGKKIFQYDTLLDGPQLDIPSFGVISKQPFCYDKNGVYERDYSNGTERFFLKKIPFNYSSPPDNTNVFISDKMNEYLFYNNQAYNRDTGLFENLTREQIDLTKTRERDLIKINGSVQFKTIYAMLLGKSGNKVYWGNEETSVDSETFEKVKGTYAYYKDKNNVYLYSYGEGLITLKGIDPGSVRLFNEFLVDKNYIYMNNSRIIKSENVEILAVYEGSWPMCGVGNPVSSTFYLFRNSEGYWLALIPSRGAVQIKKISEKDPTLKKFLGIK